jgi:hypothetical protein
VTRAAFRASPPARSARQSALRRYARLSASQMAASGRLEKTTMPRESDTDILKKIRKLLDEHPDEGQRVKAPTRLLPKPVRIWRRRSLRRVT